jgi:hypothetical protein
MGIDAILADMDARARQGRREKPLYVPKPAARRRRRVRNNSTVQLTAGQQAEVEARIEAHAAREAADLARIYGRTTG